MKLSNILASTLFGTVLVTASPIHLRRQTTSGAAYFMTNEGTGNFVISAAIGTDGKLTLKSAVAADGAGDHGITNPNGPDALFSQGSIKASAASNILAAVNAGSNTVSVFSISPTNPTTIKKLGAPASSGGQFPMSLAFISKGNQLCVLNGGEVNGVMCFKVDPKAGLTAMSNTLRSLGLNQTTPATGPAGTASHIIFSEDGTQLIASIKGVPPTPGFLAVWDVAQDGSLSTDFQQITPATGGLLPFSMTIIKGKDAVLVTDAGIGFDIFDFASVKNGTTAKNGTSSISTIASGASSANVIKGQGATCWSSFSPKTGNFYLTDIITSMVSEVNIGTDLNATLVKQYAQGNNSGTIDNEVASIGKNDFLYVLSANATSIDVLSLDAPGNATHIQRLQIAGAGKAAGLTINGNNLQGMTVFVKK